MSMVFFLQALWCAIVVFSSVQSQISFQDLESIKNQEINKTIQEFKNLPTEKSQTPSKPFLPFFELGAPAGPSKLNKEQDKIPKSFLNSMHKGIYTTLDKLPLKKRSKINFKKLTGENLGGLSPEEIYYIDKDLLIIKGGDFEGKKYLKKYGRRRKGAKGVRRIKSKAKKTPLRLRITAREEENNGNISSEEVEDSNTLTQLSIPNSELSLFLPSFKVQSHQQKQASSYHYLYMPAPLDVAHEQVDVLPWHDYVNNNHLHSQPFNFPSHINYQDDYTYHPHFRVNNAELYTNWLPAHLKAAHSYYGDTEINYKFPNEISNPDASWISLKSNLK